MNKSDMTVDEQADMDNGLDRLRQYVLNNLPFIKTSIQKAIETNAPAVAFFVCEETENMHTLVLNNFGVQFLVAKGGLEEQYTMFSTLSKASGRRTPVIAELHTKFDKLYYAITAI